MDLSTVTGYRFAVHREDLALAAGERIVAGGTWLFSEPQPGIAGLVDVTTMDWPALEVTDAGLRVAATCTIAELARMPARPGWRAHPLFFQCASALLASEKVWSVATVGGNVCRSFAAAAMVSLAVTLEATALVWGPDGSEYRVPVADLVTGNGTNGLRRGDVLRAVDLPERSLRARTGFRKIALSTLGRSGAVLTGRVDDDGAATFVITAATLRPAVLRYPALPHPEALRADAAAVETYYSDPLGAADWRRQVSQVLLEEIRQDLLA